MAAIFAVGEERVSAALRMIAARSVAATGIAMKEVLDRVARVERTLLSLGWHPYGTRTGSIPPAPPWRVSGHMSRRVKVYGPVLFGVLRPRWEGKVGPDVVYGRIHEFGGWAGAGHRSYLPPRPSLGPAWRIVRPEARLIFEHEMKRAIRL
jgi:hypothetical protein